MIHMLAFLAQMNHGIFREQGYIPKFNRPRRNVMHPTILYFHLNLIGVLDLFALLGYIYLMPLTLLVEPLKFEV